LTLDLLQRAMELFSTDPPVRERGAPIVLAEMTLRNLTADAGAGHDDFLARADILGALGFDVLVSRFEQYYQLCDYLAAYTDRPRGRAARDTVPGRRELLPASRRRVSGIGGTLVQAFGQDVRLP